jgi:hypothetical protein
MESEAKLSLILSVVLDIPEYFIATADSLDIINKKISFSFDKFILKEMATATPIKWEDPLMDGDFYRWIYRGWEIVMDKEEK